MLLIFVIICIKNRESVSHVLFILLSQLQEMSKVSFLNPAFDTIVLNILSNLFQNFVVVSQFYNFRSECSKILLIIFS